MQCHACNNNITIINEIVACCSNCHAYYINENGSLRPSSEAEIYNDAIFYYNRINTSDIERAKMLFEGIANYKDSSSYIESCREKINKNQQGEIQKASTHTNNSVPPNVAFSKKKKTVIIVCSIVLGAIAFFTVISLIVAIAAISLSGKKKMAQNTVYDTKEIQEMVERIEAISDSKKENKDQYDTPEEMEIIIDGETNDIKNFPDSIYVKEINRTCYLDGENYYDAMTGCWFWWNNHIEPNQWQYWYEGISSDFGDYGWLEYDDSKGTWWVQTDNDSWEQLDETRYDTLSMWHFQNAYLNELY